MSIPKNFTPPAGLLAERVVLVTGASSGLGRALAIECARAGATVILCGRNAAKLGRVYDEIESMGAPQPAIAMLDLATATATHYDALAGTIESEFGRLDGLVHSAGTLGDRTPLEQYDVPTWCRVLHVNLTAPFILTQVLLPSLRKGREPSIVFVSSGVVHSSRPFWGAYAVAKTGLESVRSMWAQELEGEPHIRVNSINPGRMRTPMRAAAYPAEDPETLPTPASVTGPFLYLLSALGRGTNGEYFDAHPRHRAREAAPRCAWARRQCGAHPARHGRIGAQFSDG
jgi:NAD(P)-dependent dehydrogenase (short-subunit alcohol dehydrogenase family)